MKKIEKLSEKQNDYGSKRNTDYKELLISYAEIEIKLNEMEEKFKINDTEIN